jgi:hypothetical protein
MVASTWITPCGLQFFEERKTFSHGLSHSRRLRGAAEKLPRNTVRRLCIFGKKQLR